MNVCNRPANSPSDPNHKDDGVRRVISPDAYFHWSNTAPNGSSVLIEPVKVCLENCIRLAQMLAPDLTSALGAP